MDNLSVPSITMALSKVALAAGTTTTISTPGSPAGVSVYAIKSKAYSRAALSNGATPTTDANSGAVFPSLNINQGTVVVVGFNAAGTLLAVQGPIQALDSFGNFIQAPQFPVCPDTMAPVGYIVLKAGSTLASAWTFGASNLSSVTGMTYTFVDVITIPDRPQVS